MVRLAFAATLAALAATVTAVDFALTAPGGPDLWWVAGSENVIAWTCQNTSFPTFTVLVGNSNTTLFPGPIAIISIENNFDCSKTITADQANQPAGPGYYVQLANTLNETDIYAQTEPFEIKAFGSAYPSTTSAASASATGSAGSASGSGTATGAAAAASTSSSSGASIVSTSMGFVAAAAAILGLITA